MNSPELRTTDPQVPQHAAADLATGGASQPAPLPSIPKWRYSVDSKSYDLAKYFLGDDREERVYRELAQAIQDCVEDFCTTLENAETEAHEETLRAEEREPDSFQSLGLSQSDFL